MRGGWIYIKGLALALWAGALLSCASPVSGETDLPLGSACEGPSNCTSNLCIATGGEPYCSEACPDGLCATGYLCIQSMAGPVCAKDTSARPDPGLSPDAGGLPMGGGGGAVGSSCSEIVSCTNSCADAPCFEACVAQGAVNAQALYNAVIDCVQTNCPGGEPACQQQICGAQLQACFDDTPGGGPGPDPGMGLSCPEIDACIYGQCVQGDRIDQACAQGCFDSGSDLAREQYNAVSSCTDESCQASPDPLCLLNQCGVQYSTCFPPGARGCGAVLDCVLQCQGDFACQRACQQSGDIEGQRQFLLYSACFNQNGCEAVEACDACSATLASCQAD